MYSRRLYRAKLLEKVWGPKVVELEEVKFFCKSRPEVTSVSFRESISSLGSLWNSLWISWDDAKAIGMPALSLVTQPEYAGRTSPAMHMRITSAGELCGEKMPTENSAWAAWAEGHHGRTGH